jgi:hypothetical protein
VVLKKPDRYIYEHDLCDLFADPRGVKLNPKYQRVFMNGGELPNKDFSYRWDHTGGGYWKPILLTNKKEFYMYHFTVKEK